MLKSSGSCPSETRWWCLFWYITQTYNVFRVFLCLSSTTTTTRISAFNLHVIQCSLKKTSSKNFGARSDRQAVTLVECAALRAPCRAPLACFPLATAHQSHRDISQEESSREPTSSSYACVVSLICHHLSYETRRAFHIAHRLVCRKPFGPLRAR